MTEHGGPLKPDTSPAARPAGAEDAAALPGGTEPAARPHSLYADIEAALHNLLASFRDSSPAEQADIARFAQAGTEAIMTLVQSPAWLTGAESAALLGVSERDVRDEADQRLLPAARDERGRARVHRRDLSLYRMSRQLGATEGQWTKIVTPIAWSDDLSAAGFDPWDEISPG